MADGHKTAIVELDWDDSWSIEKDSNSHVDFFINLLHGKEGIVTLPIGYCNETSMNASLGYIAAEAGLINIDALVEGMRSEEHLLTRYNGAVNSLRSPSIDSFLRTAEAVPDEKERKESFYTNSGNLNIYGILGTDFEIGVARTRSAEEYVRITLPVRVIPDLTRVISDPYNGVAEEYFAPARFLSSLVSDLVQVSEGEE